MKHLTATIASLLFILTCVFSQPATNTYTPAPQNLQARQQYQADKFGMFIHWGLYSILAQEEWIMHTGRIPVEEYEKLVPQFNPTKLTTLDCRLIALCKHTTG